MDSRRKRQGQVDSGLLRRETLRGYVRPQVADRKTD
jgi:hypothetical protein